jgi:hypothetical protein
MSLMPWLLSIANFALEWGLLGPYRKIAVAITSAVLFLTMRYLGPTVEDVRAYRNRDHS